MAASMEATLGSEIGPSQAAHPFYDHPKIHEMRSYGFGNEEQIKQALLVYLDLLEAKRWWNVRVVPCHGLQQVLVCGQSAQREPLEVVLPVRQDNELSVCDLQNLLSKVKAEQECTSLTLALMDSESTIVYYKISDGFIPPDPPESLQEKKKQRHRKFQHRKSRFVQLSRNPDHARARHFGLGHRSVDPASQPGGSAISGDRNEAGELGLGGAVAKDRLMTGVFSATSSSDQRQQGLSKRPLDTSPQDGQEGSKHRKFESQGQSSASNMDSGVLPEQPCPLPAPSPSGYLEHRLGPSYGMVPNEDNSAVGPFHPVDPSHQRKAEAEQVPVPMVQAHAVENDSDHDSGMDAGEDDEDEGFDEEL